LEVIGLDEISLKKGHRDFVTIVSAKSGEGEVSVITVLEGRKNETIDSMIKFFLGQNGTAIA
jgi:hypothetical protein